MTAEGEHPRHPAAILEFILKPRVAAPVPSGIPTLQIRRLGARFAGSITRARRNDARSEVQWEAGRATRIWLVRAASFRT